MAELKLLSTLISYAKKILSHCVRSDVCRRQKKMRTTIFSEIIVVLHYSKLVHTSVMTSANG